MIGLCGAHQTGKTTLAKAYAKKHGIPFVETHTTHIWQKLGYDARVDYSFDVRMEIQRHILDALALDYRKGGVRFITDRTPLDALAYTLADVRRENLSLDDSRNVEAYMQECFRLTNTHFTNLLLVQPGLPIKIPADQAAVKGPAIPAYLEHLNSLIFGFLADERNEVAHHYIPRAVLNLERRVGCIEWADRKIADGFKSKREALTEQGLLWH